MPHKSRRGKDNGITCLLVSPGKAPLPEEYTNVPPLVLPKNKAKVPQTNSALISYGDQGRRNTDNRNTIFHALCPTMSRHSMDVQYLNPGQPPVTACDQPLFDITKQIQWISYEGIYMLSCSAGFI